MAEKCFALIVATSEYQDPGLKALVSPARDAVALFPAGLNYISTKNFI